MNTRRAESARRDLKAAQDEAGHKQDVTGGLYGEKKKTLVMGKVFLHFAFYN